MRLEDPMLKIRNTYLSLLAQIPPGDFRPLPKGAALVDKAYFASLSWCGRVFRVPVHRPGDSTVHLYHVARPGAPVDLFQHRLSVESVPVRVYEASSFFAVFVPVASFAATDPADKAAQAVNLLLALKTPATFALIAGTSQPSYSTDPERSAPRLGDWARRIDAVTLSSDLAILVYKATYDDMMTLVSDPGTWFNELRQTK